MRLGFERYFGSPLSPVFWWPTEEKTAAKMQLDGRSYTEADINEPVEEWYLTIKDTDYAIQFLEEEVVGKDKPFFMYYASHSPHWPLQAPAPMWSATSKSTRMEPTSPAGVATTAWRSGASLIPKPASWDR